MDQLTHAISLFQKARNAYLEKKFDFAIQEMKNYRQAVDYELLQKDDQRTLNKIAISVVIVSFNSGEALLECLDSLRKQTDQDFEIILVDNGGNPGISNWIKQYALLHICPPINVLPSEGRNMGACFAKGEYLAFIDDDAIVDENYMKHLKGAFHAFDFAAIRGRILPKTTASNNTFPGHYDMGRYPIPAVLLTEGNLVIKKEVFSKIGGFDSLLFGGEGTELTHRCQRHFPKKDIYYWPDLIIYHDFPKGGNLMAKKQRHELATAYFEYLSKDIQHLPVAYGKWYGARPGKNIVYDQRRFLNKLIALIQEWMIFFMNRFAKPSQNAIHTGNDPNGKHNEWLEKGFQKENANSITQTPEPLFQVDAHYYLALVKKLQDQLEETRSSISFRLGHALGEAAVSPLQKGFKLPVVLIRLFKAHLRRQKKVRASSGPHSKQVLGAELRNHQRYVKPGVEEHVFTAFDTYTTPKPRCNRTLKIACIIGKRLYTCLHYEAELIGLDPENWLQQLDDEKVDLLLVEATFDRYVKNWRGCCGGETKVGVILRDILNHCQKSKIPTAIWDTEYRTHYEHFTDIVSCFDHVFATDPYSVMKYRAFLGEDGVTHLPLAIQPVLHNPIAHLDAVSKYRGFTILYNGWADMLEWPLKLKYLQELLNSGLHIVESRYRFVANKLNDLPLYQPHIMGYLSYGQLLSALRAYKVYLMDSASLSSPLLQGRQAMEAAACGIQVILKGPENEFIPKQWVSYAASATEAVKLCKESLTPGKEAKEHAIKIKRLLFSNHTYAHRLKTLCGKLDVHDNWEAFPRASMITPTKRPDLIKRALENYKHQDYPNKEWILVVNSSEPNLNDIKKLCSKTPGVRVFQLHEEKNIGACLNLGIEKSTGDYWFKMDDDDFYGTNYILDMMLDMRSIDADVFGKPVGFIYFEETDEIYLRGKALQSQHIWGGENMPAICGATIAGKKSVSHQNIFSEEMRACVDTDFLRFSKNANLTLYLSNVYGFMAMRKKEKSHHTWSADETAIKKNSIYVGKLNDISDVMI